MKGAVLLWSKVGKKEHEPGNLVKESVGIDYNARHEVRSAVVGFCSDMNRRKQGWKKASLARESNIGRVL